MLGRTPLVLIHNKINLLREKLEAGTRVVDHVVSFKERANDVETVVQCKPSFLQVVECLGAHATGLDFKYYFKRIYKSSNSSSKALKNLASKLQSVGSATSEPQEEFPADPPERVFKAYVSYDVNHTMHCNPLLVTNGLDYFWSRILGWLNPSSASFPAQLLQSP